MTGRCKTEYIVTGATGFLGGAVVRELISRGRSVTALALPGDPLLPLLPEGAFVRFGDVTDRASLIPAFEGAEGCRVIHCARKVSVAAGQGEALGRINVQGTENIAGLCLEYGAKRLVYVSSVHAIPERPMGEVITEECRVSPELVHGAYAKSKAAANKKVLLAAEKGLDAPIFERRSIRRGEKPFFTPYSISVLGSNGNFPHKKASDELGYSPRDQSDTLSDTLRWYPRCLYKKGGLSRPTLPYLSARHGVPFPLGTYYGRCGLMRIVKFLLARARAAALSVAPAVNMPVHDLYEALHKLPHGLSLVDEVILRTL